MWIFENDIVSIKSIFFYIITDYYKQNVVQINHYNMIPLIMT